MAKLFLDSGDQKIHISNPMSIFGAAGTESVLIDANTTGVVLDANVERVDLAGASSAFTYLQAGNQLQVYSGSTLIATIPWQNDSDGTQIVFTNGSVELKLASGVMTLGGAVVSNTTAGAVTPTTINSGITSEADMGVVPPVVPTFSVSGASSVTEGNTATFTVTLSAAQAAATTVNYAIALGGGATAADVGAYTPAASGILTFAAGEVTKNITVPVLTDALVETGETLVATLSNAPTGFALGTATATTALTDRPAPTFTITGSSSVLEGALATFTVTANRAVDADTAVTFTVVPGDTAAANTGTTNTNMADFSAGTFNPSVVTILAGQTTAIFTVTAANDSLTEFPENYSVTAAVAGVTTPLTATTSLLDGGGTFALTTGTDTGSSFTGGTGNDSFNAYDVVSGVTWTTGDAIDGGNGTDTFNVIQNAALANNPTASTVVNIETANITTGGVLGGTSALNTTAWTGLTSLNTTSKAGSYVTAATTTDVTSIDTDLKLDTTSQLVINGGKNINVTATGTTNNTTALTAATGAGAEVLIGATTQAAGTVTVSSSFKGSNNQTAGDIFVKGGTAVSIKQSTTNTTVNETNIQGAVSVVGDASTTSVTVTQDATAVASLTGLGVVGKTAGAVTITDVNATSTTAAGKITTVTLTNANTTTINSGALTTLNLAGTLTTVNAGTSGALTTPANSALALNLTGAVSSGAVTIDSDFTTLNINGQTTASTIADLVNGSVKVINVSGDAKVTFTDYDPATITDITVTNTGGAVFATSALATTTNFTGGAGADSVILASTTKAITMGAGNDTVTTSTAAVGTGGSVNAGDGIDTIIMTFALADGADANSTFNSKFTNFETLKLSDALTGALDMDGLNQASTVILDLGSTAGTINNLKSGGTVTTLANNAGTTAINVTGALGGAADVLNYNLSKTTALTAGTVTVANVENINIGVADAATAGSDAAIHTLTLTAATATSVVVTGNNGLNLTATGSAAITNFDASGIVANDTVAKAGVAATTDTAANLAVTYASLNVTTTANVTIKGGAGNDTLTGNAAKDTITGGEGADIIDGKAGVDVINLAETKAAADIVSFTVPGALNTAVNADTITGFKTTSDKLSFDAITITGGGSIAAVAGTAVTAGAVVAGAITNDTIYVINTGATALTAAGVETIANYLDLTDVAAFLAEGYTSTADNDAGIFAINDRVGGKTYLYLLDEQTAGASTINATDLALLGVVTESTGLAIVAGDIA